MGDPSLTQLLILGVVQAIVAAFSIVGAALIISQVIRNKRNRSQLQQQLVLGMSLADLVYSAAFLFPTVGLQGVDYLDERNRKSCNAQGFMLQIGVVSVIYNGTLALYYLLVIKCQFTDRKLEKLKIWFHILPSSFGLGTAFAALFLKLYNPTNWDCWIDEFPQGCQQTYNANGKEPTCIRGDNANIYQAAFFYVPLWVIILFAVAAMFTVYDSVRRQERRSERWAVSDAKQSKLVLWQSIFFVSAFLTTWTFPTAARIALWVSGSPPAWLIILAGCFSPIQGALNCIVYFRPRFIRTKKESGAPAHVVLWNIAKMSLGCCECSGLNCPWRRSDIDSSDRADNAQRHQRVPSVRYLNLDDAKDIIVIQDCAKPPLSTGDAGTDHHDSPHGDYFSENEASRVKHAADEHCNSTSPT